MFTNFRLSLFVELTFSCCLVKSIALSMPYVGVIVVWQASVTLEVAFLVNVRVRKRMWKPPYARTAKDNIPRVVWMANGS